MEGCSQHTKSFLAALMQDVLAKNAAFRFQARGGSMWPFIRDGDIVMVRPVEGNVLRTGHVVALVSPDTGGVIVHRVVHGVPARRRRGYVIKGDNCELPDGRFDRTRIVGVVCRVERNGKPTWYGDGPAGRVVALLSRTSILQRFILPVLRIIRRLLTWARI